MTFKEFFFTEGIHLGKLRKSRFQSKKFTTGTKGNNFKKDGSLESGKSRAEYKNDDKQNPLGPVSLRRAEQLYRVNAHNAQSKTFSSFKLGQRIMLKDHETYMIRTKYGAYLKKKPNKKAPKPIKDNPKKFSFKIPNPFLGE